MATPTNQTNTGLSSVLTGEATPITQETLEFNFEAVSAGQVTYTIVSPAAPANGTLFIDTNNNQTFDDSEDTVLQLNDTFTQEDINNGNLFYQHNPATESSTDSFLFSVTETQIDDQVDAQFQNFTINNVIAPLDITVSDENFSLVEGTSLLITPGDLSATSFSVDDSTQVEYNLDQAPINGVLFLDSNQNTQLNNGETALNQDDTFTQAQIDQGLLTYLNQSEGETSDSFTVRANDTEDTENLAEDPTANFEITIELIDNNAPQLTINEEITLNRGETAIVNSEFLSVEDEDTDPTDISYSIGQNVGNGTLFLDNNENNSLDNDEALDTGDTFTQGDLDGENLLYEHNGSETTGDSFSFTVEDGGGQTLGSTEFFDFNITETAPTQERNTGLSPVLTGEATPITDQELLFAFADVAEDEVTYTITPAAPANGTLFLDTISNGILDNPGDEILGLNDSFTQANIKNGELFYQHDPATETEADNFLFTLDPELEDLFQGFTISNVIAPLEITVSDDDFTVAEGTSLPITLEELSATSFSVDNPEQVEYNLEEVPELGVLVLEEDELSQDDTFTQAQVNQGLLTYINESEGGTSDSFTVSANDTEDTENLAEDPTANFEITIELIDNNAPQLVTNAERNLDEGDTVVITSEFLLVEDEDTEAANLTYTIQENVTGGTLFLDGQALDTGDTFTQGDIEGGILLYEHDGSETTEDSFSFTVEDGGGQTLGSTEFFDFSIATINDAPQLVNNAERNLDEGDTVLITSQFLLVEDEESEAANLTYTIEENVTRGTLFLDGQALEAGDTFTQADINQNLLFYQDDESDPLVDTFEFTVDDGDGATLQRASFELEVIGDPVIEGDPGDDFILNEASNDDEVINALGGDDRVYARGGDDTINGDAGNDLLFGEIGNDTLNGGLGSDRLYGGVGDDQLSGESGNDLLFGQIGEDTLNGGDGSDRLYGGVGNDIINGGEDSDILFGEIGDDQMRGGAGDDTLYGGLGADTFILASGEGEDTIRDYEVGVDQIGFADGLTEGDLSFNSLGASLEISNNGEVLALVLGVTEEADLDFATV